MPDAWRPLPRFSFGIDVEAGDEDHVLLAVDDLGIAAASMKPMSPERK
jgi:hypothetical protein